MNGLQTAIKMINDFCNECSIITNDYGETVFQFESMERLIALQDLLEAIEDVK